MLFWHRITLKHTFALIFYVLVLHWKQTRSSILIPMVFYTFYSFVQDIPLIFILKKICQSFPKAYLFVLFFILSLIPDSFHNGFNDDDCHGENLYPWEMINIHTEITMCLCVIEHCVSCRNSNDKGYQECSNAEE